MEPRAVRFEAKASRFPSGESWGFTSSRVEAIIGALRAPMSNFQMSTSTVRREKTRRFTAREALGLIA